MKKANEAFTDRQAASLAGWEGAHRGEKAQWVREKILHQKAWSSKDIAALRLVGSIKGLEQREILQRFEEALGRTDPEARAALEEVLAKSRRYGGSGTAESEPEES